MENNIVGVQGNYALGFRLEMPEKYSIGEQDYDVLNDYYSKLLNDLPVGTIFFKQDIFKEDKFDTSNWKSRNFLEESTNKYFNGLPYLKHITNLFFVLPNKSIEWNKLKNPLRKPNKKSFLEFDERIESFNTQIKQGINFIQSVKLSGGATFKVTELDNEYLNEYYTYLLGGINEDYSVDIKKEWEHLRIGNKFSTVLKFPTEDKLPEELSTCRLDSDLSSDKIKFFKNYGDNFGFDLNFSHVYNQIAVIDDAKAHYLKAKKNNEDLSKFRKFDKTNDYWAEETEKMLNEMVKNADNERVVRGHNNIVIFADSESDLKLRVDKVVDRFKDINIKPDRAYGDNLLALYEYSYPLNADLFVNEHYYIASTNAFATTLLLTGKYNDDKEGVRFNSRINSMVPVVVDNWDEPKKYMKARNSFIFAPTGYGKSFLANHIISSNFFNSKQVIVDLGESYRKLSALFPGEIAFLTYKEGQSLGINPFELREGESLTTSKMEELVEFIAVHFKRDSKINETEKAVLRKIIELYYENIKSNHSLPHFIKSFIVDKDEIVKLLDIKEEFFNVEEFILLMGEFVDNGAYSFLYKETEEQFGADLYDKRIVVFELDSISDNPLLLTVMLQLIATAIKKMIWQDKSTRGYLWFDEFAKQLKWNGVLARIEWYFQAIRKQEGGIGVILQSINQLDENNPLVKAIIDNTQLLYVLGAKNYREIQRRFNLSEHAYYQMASIKSDFEGERKYSELFIGRGEETHQVYRLEVPKQVYWAYQTEGAMNDILMKIHDLKTDMEEAINVMIDNEQEFKEIARKKKDKRITDSEVNELIKNIVL